MNPCEQHLAMVGRKTTEKWGREEKKIKDASWCEHMSGEETLGASWEVPQQSEPIATQGMVQGHLSQLYQWAFLKKESLEFYLPNWELIPKYPVEPARLGLLVTCYTLIQVSMVVKQVLNGLFCVVLSLVCPA